MISAHQDAFDFQETTPTVVSVKPLRSVGHSGKELFEDLNARLLGDSAIMQALKKSIRLVATSEETVLITGESGTGKELIARAIHDLSPRRQKPFLPLNCGALNESLLESELFGHVKGAFTGATSKKKGFFESANGGTIFLDEFAEMSLTMQQRLLRVLQEGTVRPVGSTESREIVVDTRIVVATNHDLRHDISEGKFRHDLYYRVNVLQIESPALRKRPEDISMLAQHFIRKFNEKNCFTFSETLSDNVLNVLEIYSWPGNVRELENIVKRLALDATKEGVITCAHLLAVPEFSEIVSANLRAAASSNVGVSVSRKLNCISGKKRVGNCGCNQQLDHYQQLVDAAGGNLAAVARQLHIPRTTLRKRIISLQRKCGVG